MNVMSQKSKLEPAFSVIRKFDTPEKTGAVVLAERLGLTRSAVTKWTLPPRGKGNGGTNGYIPSRYFNEILAFAKEIGVPLDPGEFVRRSEDVEAA